MIVFTGKAERIVGPVSAYRNDIQMTGDADDLISDVYKRQNLASPRSRIEEAFRRMDRYVFNR